MTTSHYIDKADIVATLRSRGLDARADFVDKELPDRVDTYQNAALLRTLDIDPSTMAPSPAPQSEGASAAAPSAPAMSAAESPAESERA